MKPRTWGHARPRQDTRRLWPIVMLGDGVPFSPPGTPRRPLELEEHHAFPDGTIRHVYTLK
jgi:hypothetical protein